MTNRLHNKPEILREFIHYVSETGVLIWKTRLKIHFQTRHACAVWNAKYAGTPALNSDDGCGYKMGRVNRKAVFAHRAAWAIHYGEWPDGIIDHIDGNRSNNKIENLRVVDDRGNARNASMQSRNKTGKIGVHWNKRYSCYAAYINDNSGRKYLGTFKLLEDAIAARSAAEIENGYHKNHGKPS